MDFSGRHIVVTGGTGVLGSALVGLLLDAGAQCRVPCHSASDASGYSLRGRPGLTLVEAGDLSQPGAVEKAFGDLPSLWASIHIAGGFAFGPLAETGVETVRRQIDMNLTSCLLCCRAAVRAMAGGEGRIVNVSARPGIAWREGADKVAYAAAKAGVAALTTALAEEVVKQGILVNAVAPSILDTPANRAAMPKANFSRWPKVEDVAHTIQFLASPENKVVRGAIVPVYGNA